MKPLSHEEARQLLVKGWMTHDAGPETIRWDVRRCFALDGVTRLGVADQYQCRIFLRIETWLDVLGVTYSVAPAVTGCMMRTDGQCWREYRFPFDTANLAAAGDR